MFLAFSPLWSIWSRAGARNPKLDCLHNQQYESLPVFFGSASDGAYIDGVQLEMRWYSFKKMKVWTPLCDIPLNPSEHDGILMSWLIIPILDIMIPLLVMATRNPANSPVEGKVVFIPHYFRWVSETSQVGFLAGFLAAINSRLKISIHSLCLQMQSMFHIHVLSEIIPGRPVCHQPAWPSQKTPHQLSKRNSRPKTKTVKSVLDSNQHTRKSLKKNKTVLHSFHQPSRSLGDIQTKPKRSRRLGKQKATVDTFFPQAFKRSNKIISPLLQPSYGYVVLVANSRSSIWHQDFLNLF